MEYPQSSVIVITILNGAVFLTLIAIIFFLNKRREEISIRTQPKLKSGLEQRLLLEAISSCALKENLDSVVESLGKHAAEVAGYSHWAIWLESDTGWFVLKAIGGDKVSEFKQNIGARAGEDFSAWIRINPYPIQLNSFVTTLKNNTETNPLLARFVNGLLIPFVDGEAVLGVVLLGGSVGKHDRRSEQFLNLFGAISAVLIRKRLLDKKEKELRQKKYQELYLARLGELAAGLAHEIRNPMTLLKSATQHFAEYYKFESQDEELKEVMLGEIKRINDHIEDLLLLGRIESREFEELNLADVVTKAVRLSEKRAVEQNIEIILQHQETRYPVMGDISLMWQLVTNLLVNSIEAIERNGIINIRTFLENKTVIMEIEDDGPGIDPEIAEKIMDPFFTTKEKGTGLGLAIAYSVAKSMDGTLELKSNRKTGACFRAAFPLIE